MENEGYIAYHAGLKDSERNGVQEDWMSGVVPIITATISFGMGVDKASVRFVVHWCAPASVAGYYQESGRAGRDGKQAYCRVYYSRQERETMSFLLKKELGSAKSERKKDRVKVSIKSFQTMIKYCEGTFCRHSVFSKYFGDDPPDCKKRCDTCKNVKAVEKKTVAFQGVGASGGSGGFRIEAPSCGVDEDLYGGGRRGQKRDHDDYARGEGGGGGSDDERAAAEDGEAKERKARNSLIRREFSSRKKSSGTKLSRREREREEKNKREEEDDAIRCSKVRAAQFTAKKITGLEVRARESYLSLLETNLRSNYDQYQKVATSSSEAAPEMSNQDILAVAVAEEYRIFSANKVVTTYRRGMAFLMAAVKKETDAWTLHKSFNDFDTREEEGEKEKEKKQMSPEPSTSGVPQNGGFQTASELLKSGVAGEETIKKRARGFVLKRDPLTQTGIKSFFDATLESSPSKSGGLFQSALEISNKQEAPYDPLTDAYLPGRDLRRSSSTASESSSAKEGTVKTWKKLGLSDESDEELEVAQEEEKPSGLNFYCDAADMSPSGASSSSPDLDKGDANKESDRESKTPNGGDKQDDDDDLSDVEAMVLQEAGEDLQEEEKLQERIREVESLAEEADLSRREARKANQPVQEIVYAEGEEEKVSQIQSKIMALQQKMAEGDDHMKYEIKMRKEEERKRKKEKQVKEEKEKEEREKEKREKKKSLRRPPSSSSLTESPRKKKIKVRVEQVDQDRGKRKSNGKSITPPKKDKGGGKTATADMVIKILVPYFKQGRIASKEVFKFLAREMTHVLLEKRSAADSSYVSRSITTFFKNNSSIVYSTDEAKERVELFQATLT